jgi:hypothetical protein
MSKLKRLLHIINSNSWQVLLFMCRGWCADEYKKTPQWFQVDFNDTFTITSVNIAGSKNDLDNYVKTYTLKYSYDNLTWHNYTYQGKEKVSRYTVCNEVTIRDDASLSSDQSAQVLTSETWKSVCVLNIRWNTLRILRKLRINRDTTTWKIQGEFRRFKRRPSSGKFVIRYYITPH